MKEWIVEVKLVPQSDAWNLAFNIPTEKGNCLPLGYRKQLAQYAEWTKLELSYPKVDGPYDLEEAIERTIKHSFHPSYNYRLFNIRTRETIPMEIFQ